MNDFKLKKYDIHSEKVLEPHEKHLVKEALTTQGRVLIHPELEPAHNDYAHDFDRGTVHYTPKCRNYSFHKVIIPDGTKIVEANFTQLEIHTRAIIGKNLIFIECNLVNNFIDDSWVLDNCNTTQVDLEVKEKI